MSSRECHLVGLSWVREPFFCRWGGEGGGQGAQMPKLLELPFRMLWNKPGEEKSSPCGSSGIGGLVFGASMDFFTQPGTSWSEGAFDSGGFCWYFLFPPKFSPANFLGWELELGKKNTRSLNFGGPELGENTKRLLRMSKKHDQIWSFLLSITLV